ncbi:putative lipopolysaccharide-modifying enzyme [Lyophyllum shimeji]|uniref:Lipopolysaccharide-modifying enzyme n=1 Tax=Lyophyllum shimeji TaxID=47721 RepID=A0A9P3PPT7_LYOSH|nr:putative lipopolysaccharide-modifying enzyme [Lyophyllum shimeji]
MRAGFLAGHNHRQKDEYSNSFNVDWLPTTSTVMHLSTESRAPSVIKEHPIPKLMDEAEAKYRQKLAGQSKTLKSAVAEYRRRYKRDPPKGFDAWCKFAQEHDVKLVDEYDGLVADLAPFWELSGEELRRRAMQAGELPSIDLVRIEDGKSSTLKLHNDFEDSEVSARANGFRAMLSKFEHTLPDMDFPINAKAEGRVLVPWEHRKYPNLTVQDSSAGVEAVLDGPFKPDWGDNGTVWEAWRRTCAPTSPARRVFASLRNSFTHQIKNYLSSSYAGPSSDLKFVATTSASTIDFCSKPYEHYKQGHFFSDWRTIPALYPVFSPARAKGFLDIKIPSHYYYGSTKRYTYGWDAINLELKEVDNMEVSWEEKIDKIFWRGATTGGGSHPPGFSPQYQRHRFLRMASDKSSANRTVVFADSPSSNRYVSAPVPVAALNEEIMDTAFVKAVANEAYPGGLKALKDVHRFGDAVPLGKHWSYKYLVDFDGMSYSGRFMAFLASDSVPVKATVYEEYFSDWIQPWVHFIPLSSSYREIYNIHAYFSGPTRAALEAINSTYLHLPDQARRSIEGDRRLRRIARAGKHWKKTIGRTIDMEVYVYRLCLEWARLWADDRESMTFRL